MQSGKSFADILDKTGGNYDFSSSNKKDIIFSMKVFYGKPKVNIYSTFDSSNALHVIDPNDYELNQNKLIKTNLKFKDI